MAGDANYASVGLLLHGNGANLSTTITDNGPTPKVVTPVGGAKISSDAWTGRLGNGSIKLNGSADYCTVPYSADFDFPADFSLETICYLTAWSASYGGNYGAVLLSRYLAGGTNTGWQVTLNGTASAYNSLNVYTGLTNLAVTGLSLALNTKYVIGVFRTGSTLKVMIDGTVVGTFTNSANFTRSTGSTLYVGKSGDPTVQYHFPGYLEEIRITKAVGRQSAAYTPSAIEFLNGLGEVGGVIRDASGALCSRTVRLIRRDTGAHIVSGVSDATTGAYLLATPTLDEVVRIVHSSTTTAPLENDLIDRVIPA